jgi:hypothetical protein
MLHNFHDVTGRLTPLDDRPQPALGVQRFQEIPDSFKERMREVESRSKHERSGDYKLAASIPAIFVAKWFNEGFNVYTEPMSAIVKKCKAEGLDDFLVKGET